MAGRDIGSRALQASGLFQKGLELFNQAEFFEAHEVWEDVWRPAIEPERMFLQGLIQAAVALHHHSTGNLVGARSLLRRASVKLAACPVNFCGIDMPELCRQLSDWQSALEASRPVPPLPRLRSAGDHLPPSKTSGS